MVIVFLFSFSISYLKGFKWFEYKQYYDVIYSTHIIQSGFKNFSLEFRLEHLDIHDWELYYPLDRGFQYLFTIGIFKSFKVKGIEFEPLLASGSLTHFLFRKFISFIFSPSFKIKKRIPNTNFIIGLDYSFYLPVVFLKNTFLRTDISLYFLT